MRRFLTLLMLTALLASAGCAHRCHFCRRHADCCAPACGAPACGPCGCGP